jgi:DNA-binding transcriptional ArsR family regulator
MLTLLSLPAALMLAINMQHTVLLTDMEVEREARRKQRQVAETQLHAIDKVDTGQPVNLLQLTGKENVNMVQLPTIDEVDRRQPVAIAGNGGNGNSYKSQLTSDKKLKLAQLSGNRFKIYKMITEGGSSATKMARELGITRQAVSSHVAALRSDGLID